MIKVEEILISEDSKLNFLKALIRTAKSDHIIRESEKEYFLSAARVLGISNDGVESLADYWNSDSIPVSFSNSRESILTIMQIIQLCWIDGEYVDAEKEEVRKLASELGITQGAVEKIEEWVYRGMEWTKEGDLLLDLV